MNHNHVFKAWHRGVGIMVSTAELVKSKVYLSPDGRGFIGYDALAQKEEAEMDWLIPLQCFGMSDKNGQLIFDEDVLQMDYEDDHGRSYSAKAIIAKEIHSHEIIFKPLDENWDPEWKLDDMNRAAVVGTSFNLNS